MFAVFSAVHMLSLLAIIPLIAGTILIMRPSQMTMVGRHRGNA